MLCQPLRALLIDLVLLCLDVFQLGLDCLDIDEIHTLEFGFNSHDDLNCLGIALKCKVVIGTSKDVALLEVVVVAVDIGNDFGISIVNASTIAWGIVGLPVWRKEPIMGWDWDGLGPAN